MARHYYSYLALGDSYTIGEGLPLHESFPCQAVQLLRKAGLHFHAPEIVAKTGWTSFELAEHILHTSLNEAYDYVSLMIGVNNQYRGLPADEFRNDFRFLLQKAIHLANGNPAHVFVLSIPDWGATPFAARQNSEKISAAIDAFNAVCEDACKDMKTTFIDITPGTRKAGKDKTLLAPDQLHYSAKEYSNWAGKLAELIKQQSHK